MTDLDAPTIEALREHRKEQAAARLALGPRWHDEGLVFARDGYRLADGQTAGGPLHPERLSRHFDRRISILGLTDIRLHDLRHTWATLALKEGVHPKVVQERLGHANVSVTLNIYSHVVPGVQREAAERVSALFS